MLPAAARPLQDPAFIVKAHGFSDQGTDILARYFLDLQGPDPRPNSGLPHVPLFGGGPRAVVSRQIWSQ